MSSYPPVVSRLVDGFAARRPMRAKSMIITFFGDVASQHGQTVWLGSLIATMAKLGINERLVRTSVFRLVQEGWLESNRVGRRSYYRFSTFGLSEYERVTARIYDLEEPIWSRVWQLVVPVNVGEQVKDAFFRSLSWQGYRQISPGLFARPGAGGVELQTMLEEYGVRDNVLLMNADESALSSRVALREVIDTRWKLDEVAADYRSFLKRFQPLQRWLSQKSSIDTEAALIIRLLLVHEYRRLLLKDTPLPAVLLPSSWPGTKAKLTAAGIYRQVANPSVTYIMAHLEGLHGLLPEPSKQFTQRFAPQPIANAN